MSRFTDASQFPAFYELPSTSDSDKPSDKKRYLLAQIKENMTITKPTLIVTDRKGVDFALLFEDSISLKGFRKGHTVVVPGAKRTDREGEGKKAVVHVPVGQGVEVKVISGSLERVLELGVVLEGQESMSQRCAACGKTEGAFMKCTGCSFTAYCGKDCQVKGWGEMDHKSNCKVLKVLRHISI